MSQTNRLLEYLGVPNASITRLQASDAVGIFELSARIIELEELGYEFHKPRIKVVNRFNDSCRVCCYSLHSKHFKNGKLVRTRRHLKSLKPAKRAA